LTVKLIFYLFSIILLKHNTKKIDMKNANPYFLFVLFSAISLFTIAQQLPQHSPDSKAILLKGVEYYEKGEYKKAVIEFSSVHRNDTSYRLSLYESALSLLQDSLYKDALNTIHLAIAEDDEKSSLDYLILKANILDEMGSADMALKLYDSIITIYPASFAAKSQKVTTLYRLKRYKEAETLALECVKLNFLNPLGHYKLGYINYQEGKMVPALMAFMMAQIVHPSHTNAQRVVTFLSFICNAKDEAVEFQQKREGDYPDNFNMVEQIVFSKIALDKGYKVKFNMDDKIFRQINVMMEKLQFDESSDDPYMQLYVPFFKQVLADKRAEELLNHAFSGLDIEEIKSYIKKNKSDVTKFTDYAYNYSNLIRSTRVVSFNDRQNAPAIYHFDENRFFGKGKVENGKGEGEWEFYHPEGNLKAKGRFVNDEKNGEWKFFYDNGAPQSIELFVNGKLNGNTTTFYRSGGIKKQIVYKDDKAEGLVKGYNRFGVLLTEENYLQDELHGKTKNYYNEGLLKSEFNYENGKLNGPFVIYYSDHSIKEQGSYKNDELDGKYKLNYTNGVTESEGLYTTGKLTGIWTYKHKNGKLYYKVNMTEKGIDGEMVKYNDDGSISSKEQYKEGVSTGVSEYYHQNKIYVTYKNNSKGNVSELHYYDKSGAEILSNKRNGKSWPITYYSPYGYKTSDKTFDQNENLVGEVVYYNAEGNIVAKELYQEGLLEGVRQSWYYNKQLKDEIIYSGDKKEGISKVFYSNGKPSLVSFYSKDIMEDYQYDYTPKGILQTVYFYKEGEKHGHCIVNYPNGKPYYEEKYSYGWLTQVTQFDTSGNKLPTIYFEKGNGVFKLLYPNGKIYYEIPLVNGVYQGVEKKYFPDGKIMSEIVFKNDQKSGFAKYYNLDGKLSTEGNYFNDLKTGTWKSYDNEGKVDELETFIDGELDGTCKYYDNGILTREINYKEGDREGALIRYNNSGGPIFQLYYEDGLITSYSYYDKNKKLLPPIYLKNLTGTVLAFYPGGQKAAEIDVASGYYNGKFKLYNEKGIIIYESTEQYSFTNGTINAYHENGKLKTTQTYEHNILEGPVKEFYPDGKIKSESVYEGGSLNGPYKKYDATGKLIETQYYYYGYIMGVKK
jgi:uncharacterized protein